MLEPSPAAPFLTVSPARCAVFGPSPRRPTRRVLMFQDGALRRYQPPPNVEDGWASGPAFVCILTEPQGRRWLTFSWSINTPIDPASHDEILAACEPRSTRAWITQRADTRTRWDRCGCRVRFTLSGPAASALQSLAGDAATTGAWLHRILHPRLCQASVRIVVPTHLHLFIPE